MLFAAFAVFAAVYLYRPLTDNPSYSELALGADKYNVEIVRDEWGVPHIKGRADADTSFGLAYAHAEDDYQTIQTTVAAGRGILASYQGKGAATTDYIVALLDVWNDVDSKYEAHIPADVKALAEGYAAGMNLYAAHNPEATWQGLAPFTAKDVIAGFVFKTPFFYGFDEVLLDLFDPERKRQIALAPTEKAWQTGKSHSRELGSNAIAVAAHRSPDSTTRLLINSHQPLTGPVAWYEAHLISGSGWDITGGLFPGTPVILHGFNRHLAWANTVNKIDLADNYVLIRNPNNPMQYKLDGKWLDFEKKDVTIDVKLWGSFRYPARRTVLRSKHGPVIESGDATYAVRYAGINEVRQLEQYYRINKAQNLEQFMQAMRMNALPSINYIYADKDHNIGFIHNAQYPERNDNWDWSKDLPGDRSDLIWQNYRPYANVPKLINPQSGLVFNSNNTPFTATDGTDNLLAENFPQSMGLATNQTNRALRILELNDGVTKLGREEILLQKFDDAYSEKSDYLKIAAAILKLDPKDDAALKKVQAHFKLWDKRTNIENQHAAVAVKLMGKIVLSDTPEDLSRERLVSEAQWVVEYLTRHYGSTEIRWGAVNRFVRGDKDFAIDGGPDILRAVYAMGFDDDEKPFANAGDSWIALVAWDENGEQSAEVIHQFGNAADKSSPNYDDQVELFVNKKWRKAELDFAKLKSTASRVYTPQSMNKH